ncbi:ribonucleases P/MRP protein subunit POP1 isoform X2 [Argentina anserina]|nr:ribonucleases P/MRP protein subunit POP1 isoform X2 [Potentilla anserina]
MATDGRKRSQVSSAPPRKISVEKFAEARASELEALHTIVSERLNKDFRSQRSKRRRTTAHDNQATKRRSRKKQRHGVAGQSDALPAEKDDKNVPRRIRRRAELKKNLEEGFCTSGDGTKRLRTHVWHAKRFTMTKLWGYYLPLGLHGRGRGSRAVLKWFKDGVLAHDASYHVAVQLEGTEECLLSVLRMVLVPSPSARSEDAARSIIAGAIYDNAMLHEFGAPCSTPIAPVTCMWRSSCQQNKDNDASVVYDGGACNGLEVTVRSSTLRQLWVWIHASAFTAGYDALKLACQKKMEESSRMICCISLEGQLAKLEVMGSKSFQLLQRTLCPVTRSNNHAWALNRHSLAEAPDDFKSDTVLENEVDIPSHAVLSLRVKDPRMLVEKQKTANAPESGCASILGNVQGTEDRENAVNGNISDKKKERLSLMGSELEGTGMLTEKSLWDVNSGVSPPVEDMVICQERYDQNKKFFCLDESYSEVPSTSTNLQCSRSCPVLLLKNDDGRGLHIGWSVILPLSWVRAFWVPLVSKGAHAIGVREKHWISCDVGLPYFPSDFPDCNAYLCLKETETAASNVREKLRPPAQRPLRVPTLPPWKSIQDSLREGPTKMSSNSLSNSECESSVVTVCPGDLFDGFMARTSFSLANFLNKFQGFSLRLCPHVTNKPISFTSFMRDESKAGQSQNGMTNFSYNHKLCFVRVFLHAYKEGFFEEGAVVCAPQVTDISLWTRSESSDGGLQVPQSAVASYLKEQSSGKWELQLPEDSISRQSYRWPIGFVTTGFVRGSKKTVAQAFCEAVLLAQIRGQQWDMMPVRRRRKEIYVLVRNLRSSAYRLALATIVLEDQEEDVGFF